MPYGTTASTFSNSSGIIESSPSLNCRSLDDIIPPDLIRNILSFEAYPNQAKCVNKQWMHLSNQNQKRYYHQLFNSTASKSSTTFKFKHRKSWIVIRHGERLRPLIKTALNPNILIARSFVQAYNQAQFGDRIFVQRGHELPQNRHEEYTNLKNVSIIGLEKNTILVIPSTLCILGDVYLQNLTIKCSNLARSKKRRKRWELKHRAKIYIGAVAGGSANGFHQTGTLNLDGCQMMFKGKGMTVRRGSSLIMNNCVMKNGWMGMTIRREANEVTIKNSTFSNFKQACIKLNSQDTDKKVKLECIGNTFEGNSCYPIGENLNTWDNTIHELIPKPKQDLFSNAIGSYRLQDNIVRSKDGLRDSEMMSGNKIYHLNNRR